MLMFPDINAKTFKGWASAIEAGMMDDGPMSIAESDPEIAKLPVTSAVGMRAVMLCTSALQLSVQLKAMSDTARDTLWEAVESAISTALYG